MGRIFDGRELGWTLDSHVATFRSITSMEAELRQNGAEPPLSVETKPESTDRRREDSGRG